MRNNNLRSIAIVGGGLAGWLAAAVLARLLKRDYCRISVVERPQRTSLGVAEATIPAFQRINNLLGLDENEIVRKTRATFRLGTAFEDWSHPGETCFHTFCAFGGVMAGVPFHHYWLRLRELGDTSAIEDYSIGSVAARLGRFAPPVEDPSSPLSLYSHAYHLDTARYADMLRVYACGRGVERFDRTAMAAELRQDGFIDAVMLDDGRKLQADFFIDCSNGLLIEDTLKTGYEDWGRWLPTNRAVSVEGAADPEPPPYTRVRAGAAGWQWRMPLQDRSDNGHVYCSDFLDDDAAAEALLRGFGAGARATPRFSKFIAGRPKKYWNRNCLALPGGFLEPLEATDIHRIQTGILKLYGLFPDRGFDPGDADEYNRVTAIEHERIRDFLILHYWAAQRDDTPFWRHCRDMELPDTLRHKIELFRGSGRVAMYDNEHFSEQSWLSLFLGQHLVPPRHDPLADIPPSADLRQRLQGMAAAILQAAQSLPTHKQYLARIAGVENVA